MTSELLAALLADTPVDDAIRRAVAATGVADAFLAGLEAALRTLVPGETARVALCATEDEGAHPRGIKARLTPDGDGFRLDGVKRWSTMAPRAEALLVVASTGVDDQGRNRLRVARVDRRAPGVTVEEMPATPFVPEVPHGVVTLREVRVEQEDLLPGDGWERYLRPFRTIEDTHVHAALLAYVLGVATRAGWARERVEELVALIASARAAAVAGPGSPSTHLLVAGLIRQARRFLEETTDEWDKVDPDERARWRRDAPLLTIAAKVRELRREAAWRSLAPETGG